MHKIEKWLKSIDCSGELETVCADASFRKYYRLKSSMHSGIVMDSSLQKESLAPFLDISHRLYEANVRVPKIFTFNKEEGFVFLEDMGKRHLNEITEESEIESYYEKAVDTLINMQETDTQDLPLYDKEFLHFEMDLMPTWYLEQYLGKKLDDQNKTLLNKILGTIATEVMAQPQEVFVHRDYHSRNIMLSKQDQIIVIDYQDARKGAITYDLVSLLRDVYTEFDPVFVEKMALRFRDFKGLNVDDKTFMRWFDFMGLQRHIKILGIFARLHLRDGKEGYLQNIPLTLKYIHSVAAKYPEIEELLVLFSDTPE